MSRLSNEALETMLNLHDIGHVTPADWNLFADLGFSPKEAKALLKNADARIAKLAQAAERRSARADPSFGGQCGLDV